MKKSLPRLALWLLSALSVVAPLACRAEKPAPNIPRMLQGSSVPAGPFTSVNSPEWKHTFTSKYADVNGIRLHYVTGGTGTPLILLHGYPQTWYGRRKVMPTLAQKYTLVVPDMRGLGDSSRPADGDYTKKTVADDVYKLCRSLGYTSVDIAGQDMGAPVAYAFAASHPDYAKHLVVIEGGAIPGFGLEDLENPAKGGSWHFGFFATPEFPELLTKGHEREFLTRFAFRGRFVYQKAAMTDADIAEYEKPYLRPGGMVAGFGCYRAFAQDAKDNQILNATKLAIPVLTVGADKSFGDTSEAVRRYANNARSVVVKDCGHFVYDEQPDELARQMLAFLSAS